MSLEPYQERVLREKTDLEDKINKLDDFRDSDRFSNLEFSEKELLNLQYHSMYSYWSILNLRINNWDKK